MCKKPSIVHYFVSSIDWSMNNIVKDENRETESSRKITPTTAGGPPPSRADYTPVAIHTGRYAILLSREITRLPVSQGPSSRKEF
jgi:hypothetical protein